MTDSDLPNCSVLRCLNVAAVPIRNEISYHPVETAVCEEHKAAIDGGAAWDWDDRRVLMGDDLPELTRYTVRDSGGTRGVTVTLETAQADKPFSVFLTPEAVDQFMVFLKTRGTSAE